MVTSAWCQLVRPIAALAVAATIHGNRSRYWDTPKKGLARRADTVPDQFLPHSQEFFVFKT
jgi:hypothetical protein